MINIFNKKINDLTYNDVKKLVNDDIKEGWMVEYKRQFKKSKDIAKSISSFANSEGGYYIVGIKESDDEKNEPNEIIGISHNDKNSPYEKIANAIKDHISPVPYFETKVIDIPNSDRYIVVVMIPEGKNPPYLHHGSIYQRVGEVTNPKTIKDRYILDYLIAKSEKNEKNMNNFFENDISIMKEKNNPILELYFYNKKNYLTIPQFFQKETITYLKNTFDDNIEILPTTKKDNIKANFEVKYNQSYKSYIIKNIADGLNIFCEIFMNGNCKIIIDIPCRSLNTLKDSETEIFANELSKTHSFDSNSLDNFLFIDVGNFYNILTILINKYLRFLESYENFSHDLLFKFKLLNCGESTLKFNITRHYKEYYEKFGIPICYKNYIESDVLSINNTLITTNKDKSKYAIAIYIDILMSLGLIVEYSKCLIAEQISSNFYNE